MMMNLMFWFMGWIIPISQL